MEPKSDTSADDVPERLMCQLAVFLKGTGFCAQVDDNGLLLIQKDQLPQKWRFIIELDFGDGTPEDFEITVSTWHNHYHVTIYNIPYGGEGGYPSEVSIDFVIDYALRLLRQWVHGEEFIRIFFSDDGSWLGSESAPIKSKGDMANLPDRIPAGTRVKAICFSWVDNTEWQEDYVAGDNGSASGLH